MSKVAAVLRYSRYHGLCYDYRQEDPLSKLEEVDLVQDLAPLPDLSDFLPPLTEPPTDSKLQLGQKASKLLISATTQLPVPLWSSLPSDYQKTRPTKVEQPLLLTDHQKDMRRFLPKRSVGLDDVDFPFESLSEENDEGLSWPASIRRLCAQMDSDIAHEKLSICKDSLEHLSYMLRDDWTPEAHKRFVMELLLSKKQPTLHPMSPPLLLEDAIFSPTVPFHPPLETALTSEPMSLTSLPTDSPPRGPAFEDYELSTRIPRPEFKLPAYHLRYSEYEDDDLIDYQAGETSSSTITEETNEAAGGTLERLSRNDFISARSRIIYISVPKLNSYMPAQSHPLPSVPVADDAAPEFQYGNPHKHSIHGQQLQEREISPTKSEAFSENLETIIPNILHGIKATFDLKLLAEGIEGHGYEPPPLKIVIKSQQMLWKPEKLSLLKEDDDDEEELVHDISVAKADIEDDLKLENKQELSPSLTGDPSHFGEAFETLSEYQLAKKEQEAHVPQLPDSYPVVSKKRKPLEDIIDDVKRQNVLRDGIVSRFSASGSLSSFLGTRQDTPAPQVEDSTTYEEHADVLVPGTPDPVFRTNGPRIVNISTLDPPRTVFFSATCLQTHQSLLRFFEAWAGDDLNIIYRDLKISILLSPKHAVMMTTLQALTQRPLPGQGSGGRSTVHDQISLLGQRAGFELLTIVVSAPSFVSNDRNTMSSFSTYCEGISRTSACQIRPWYIPAGEADLHTSVAKLILDCGFHTETSVFVEDETHWESFLAGVGMNPFAAQVVLGLLEDDGSGRPWGLRAFVQMDRAAREERFGSLIGKNVLERVARQIEVAVSRGD